MRLKFFLYSKGMKAIQTIKITIIFDVTPLNNADNFYLPSISIWGKKLTCISRVELCFETTVGFLF